MKTTKIGEMLYIVSSEAKGEAQNYTVNLRDNSNWGSCTCKQFTVRVYARAWKNGNNVEPCKHIHMALGVAAHEKLRQKTFTGRASDSSATLDPN